MSISMALGSSIGGGFGTSRLRLGVHASLASSCSETGSVFEGKSTGNEADDAMSCVLFLFAMQYN